jgi:hypothetical protein
MAGPAPLGGDGTSIGAAAARSKIRHPVGGHGTIPSHLTCRYMSAWDGTRPDATTASQEERCRPVTAWTRSRSSRHC